jgi:hypothetical protein
MKVKLLVVAAALLMLTTLSFAQPFILTFDDFNTPLRDMCTGQPLPEGTPIWIYVDANGNGPDAADQLPELCDNAPNCTGPAGTYNLQFIPINGPSYGQDPGTFFSDPSFVSVGMTPPPGRYYLVCHVPCPPGYTGTGTTWTSPVVTVPSTGGPVEVDFEGTDWTCTSDCTPGTTCTPSGDVSFAPSGLGPQDQSHCITLCSTTGASAMVCVGPLLTQDQNIAAGRIPDVQLTYGCPGCDPGANWSFDGSATGPWTLQYMTGQWYYCQPISIGAGTEGCATLHFDNILAASVTDVKVLPQDNAVNVSFKTSSSTNLDRFEIMRDDHMVGRLDAVNQATEHAYSFVDNSAANGTTYKYDIVMVDLAGVRTVVGTASVTPSMMNAVVTEYALHQNFPNPFNPTTSIRFDLVEKNFVSLKIYNANGQVVATIVNGERDKGVNVVNFDATNLTSGLYFYTVKVGNVYSATKKMLLVK